MDHEPLDLVDTTISESFKERYKNFPQKNRLKISAFIAHVKNNGFENLEGRNKFSDDISTNDPDFIAKVKFVREYCLWHYHIGIDCYASDSIFGDRTSMFVLHYSRVEVNKMRVVDMSPHPPFTLPTTQMFT